MHSVTGGFWSDVANGYRATRRLIRRAGKKPFGDVSSDWRSWLYPQYVMALAVAALVAALGGNATWQLAILIAVALASVSLWMTARLGRRYDRDYPETDA